MNKERSRIRVIAAFFTGLALLAGLLWALAPLLDRWLGMPALDMGSGNAGFGSVLLLIGGALVIWAVSVQYTIGKGTPHPMAATQKLVVSGPYAWSRNPMTLGAVLFYLGIAVWLGSLAGILLTLLISSLLLVYIYVHETHELTRRFGEGYLEYKRRTPFLLGHWSKRARRQRHP
jgi:protein-S-isoprenylcysteine O-methyltransferase Ste14